MYALGHRGRLRVAVFDLSERVRHKASKAARQCAGMQQRGSGHMLRHRCTTPLLEDGDDSRTVQAWLGHKDVSPTMLYTQVLQRGGRGVRRPLHLQLAHTSTAPPSGAHAGPYIDRQASIETVFWSLHPMRRQ
ncbi:MAG: hypothetical protein FJZ47_15825 [Candidatus Tectomicrobia bacterium]|uniref:Tyr recombinase domain-containing protein n=1 Tax=Tectimicrobiota bacterium TaxID=2528274 RepID=A0A938B511_UNCTE|nr:hypothetical protein [Candidatus Tectomicrobia bacterium]